MTIAVIILSVLLVASAVANFIQAKAAMQLMDQVDMLSMIKSLTELQVTLQDELIKRQQKQIEKLAEPKCNIGGQDAKEATSGQTQG